MYYVFTEDDKGRWGFVGERDSYVTANDLAEKYLGITHVIEATSLAEAKQKLRAKKIRETNNLGLGYRNVRNKATLEAL